MLKKILISLGVIVGLMITAFGLMAWYFYPSENTIPEFIKANPERSSIILTRNGELLANHNTSHLMNLASTMKIIVAMEYARQAAVGIIHPDELISLDDLNKFYIPHTDGGAHPAWLNSMAAKFQDQRIALREVAKGMIKYSSNANTEWLMTKLGLDKINQQIDTLNLQSHTPIYPIVSALFVSQEAASDLEGDALIEALYGLPDQDYQDLTMEIHQKLWEDQAYKETFSNLDFKLQKLWSDRLPASTAKDYHRIMQLINDRQYFDELTHEYLDEVMGHLLENPANRQWIKHTGSKGGSTAFVLTQALYVTEHSGDKTELVYFFNDLNPLEQQRLQMSLNAFELKVLTDPAFRDQIKMDLLD